MEAVPVIAGWSDGEPLWFGGGLLRIKVSSAQTGGVFMISEDAVTRGKTTPLHVHDSFDETFFVVEGAVTFHVDGTEFATEKGATAAVPRGTPHAFLVTSETARLLTFFTPGDVAERFLREGGDVPTDIDAPVPPLDVPKVVAAGELTGGMRLLGPPPFAAVSAPAR